MESLIEQSVCTNNRCYACGALVYDVEKRKTANHIYHHRCFCCRICKRNLTASSLNEEVDDIYCTNCYRKKQRGDCKSSDFQRAASERGELVYNHRHPDQPPPTPNPQRPNQHNLSRHPSWTLHQLERQFLSLQPKINGNYETINSFSHPLVLKTSFSTPITLSKFRHRSSSVKNEPSPALHFSPVFSPYPNELINSKSTPKQITKTTSQTEQTRSRIISINSLRARLHQSSVDLTNVLSSSPSTRRKPSVTFNLKENSDKKESKIFVFPDLRRTPLDQRSASTTNTTYRRKLK